MPAHAVRQDPASASVFAAMLENSVTQNPLDEWLRSPSRDIHTRLVHFSSPVDGPAPTASYGSSPPYSRTIRSSSSMAPALVHQSNASTHPPSLYNYSDATPTETSVSTGLASHLSGVPLLEEVNGVLVRRPTAYRAPMYECVFWFLNCQYASNSQEEWNVHCLSHFQCEEPPRSVQCPLCEFAGTWDDGWTAWNARMEHIAICHAMLGETLKRSRPDFHLFTHLWQKRLIDDQDLKELKSGNHNLTRRPDNFVSTGGGGRHRERNGPRRRAQHVGVQYHGGRPGQ